MEGANPQPSSPNAGATQRQSADFVASRLGPAEEAAIKRIFYAVSKGSDTLPGKEELYDLSCALGDPLSPVDLDAFPASTARGGCDWATFITCWGSPEEDTSESAGLASQVAPLT